MDTSLKCINTELSNNMDDSRKLLCMQNTISELNISPSDVIMCIWPADKESHYNVRLLHRIHRNELVTKTLNEKEFTALKENQLFQNSCMVLTNRSVPAKLLISQSKIIDNMQQKVNKDKAPYTIEIPNWIRERRQPEIGVPHILSIMENLSKNFKVSEDLRKYLYWSKKYNINVNIKTDALQTKLRKYTMQCPTLALDTYNLDSMLLQKYLSTIPDMPYMQQMLIEQLLTYQQDHVVKRICGSRPHTKPVQFRNLMCECLSFKSLPQAFGDLVFYLYEELDSINENIKDESNVVEEID